MNPQPDLSPNDGYLIVINSEIMCGVMDKATVGSGKKKSIFGVIMRDYGPDEAAVAMNRVAKLCARWLGSFCLCLRYTNLIFTLIPSEYRLFARYFRRHSGAFIVKTEGKPS